MLFLNFYNYYVLLPFLISFISFWIFFIRNNFFSVRINPASTDILKNSKVLKKIHYNFFVNWSLTVFIYLNLSLFFLKFDFNLFWFNHLKINNFIINLVIIIAVLNWFVINLVKYIKNNNINFNIDYFLSLFNLGLFIPLIFLSNTFYTFIFLLEVNSLLILYKFSVSRYWFKKNLFLTKTNQTFNRVAPKSYLNMIFFQYWANFFSSILIMFTTFNIIYLYGSSEWMFVDFLNFINLNLIYLNNFNFYLFLWVPFFIGFFLKIGLTPLHLFKIEVYKGIPFISIFFYTTYYFLSFFLFFILIVFYYINSFKLFWWLFFIISLFLGMFYIISLLFDVNLIKSFFAYSTIINVLTFMTILIVSL